MDGMAQWLDLLRHAFAIPAEADFAATEAQRALAERLCAVIRERGLAAPALIVLESFRPLNYVGAQSLHFFTPFLMALSDTTAVETLARLLERPGSVEFLCRILERGSEAQDPGKASFQNGSGSVP
jgi:hypothetical protein